jgi:hypothetical protein
VADLTFRACIPASESNYNSSNEHRGAFPVRMTIFSSVQPEIYLRRNIPVANRTKNSSLSSMKYVWNALIGWCKKERCNVQYSVHTYPTYLACYCIANTWQAYISHALFCLSMRYTTLNRKLSDRDIRIFESVGTSLWGGLVYQNLLK